MTAKRVRKPRLVRQPKKIEFETFRSIKMEYEISWMAQSKPSVFDNNEVRIRKNKITVEVMDEPEHILQARLQKLWNEELNEDNRNALMYEARKLGYELEGEMGNEWDE